MFTYIIFNQLKLDCRISYTESKTETRWGGGGGGKRNLESLIHDRIASALNTMCGSAALLNRVET